MPNAHDEIDPVLTEAAAALKYVDRVLWDSCRDQQRREFETKHRWLQAMKDVWLRFKGGLPGEILWCRLHGPYLGVHRCQTEHSSIFHDLWGD